MAHNIIFFQNPHTGKTRRAPVGYSWTMLLFGPLVFLSRKEWALFGVTLVLTILTLHLSNILLSFKVNRMYVQMLINLGYRVSNLKRGTEEQVSEELGLVLPSLSSFLFTETRDVKL